MIHEAIDAAITVGWALLAWIAVLAAAATVAVFTLIAAPVVAWQAVTRGVAAGLAAVQGTGAGEAEGGAEKTADAHTAARGPSWARTDTEEAA